MLRNQKSKSLSTLLTRLVLGGVFIYASVDKIIRPEDFAAVVFNYRILPDVLINVTAVILPWLEFFLGLSLILGIWLPGGVLTCNILLAIFSIAIAFNLLRGLDIGCGCFGSFLEPGSRLSMVWYLLRDAVLLGLGIYVLSQQTTGHKSLLSIIPKGKGKHASDFLDKP